MGSQTSQPFCSPQSHRPHWALPPTQHPLGPLPSPGVPSPTSHALQCSLQLADPPVELRAELEADQAMSDPTNTGPQATHWAC